MKKIIFLLTVLALLAAPAYAQGPVIWLPWVMTEDTMPAMAILRICDYSGGTCVNLIKGAGQFGYHLKSWIPTAAGYKDGGVWQDSPLADGRRPVATQDENGIETFDLALVGVNQDGAIRDSQTLRRLLRQATNYFTSPEDELVYITAQASCESRARYAIVYAGQLNEGGSPYAQPFLQADGSAVMDNLTLVVERGPWTACKPGTGACVKASGRQTGWEYEAWTVNTALPIGEVTEFLDASCGNLLATDFDGVNPDIWRTANGTVWNNSGASAPTNPPVAFVDASDGFIYVACQAEVWRSVDCGATWVQRSAVHGVASRSNSICEHTDGYLYMICDAVHTIRRSNDGAATWNLVYTGPPTPMAIIAASDGYMYVTATGLAPPYNEIILRSLNGTTWVQVFSRILPGSFTGHAFAMIKELSDGYLYAGAVHVGPPDEAVLYRSANGTDWGQIATFPGLSAPSGMVLTSGGTYYIVFATGEVYTSPDAIDWKPVIDIGGSPTTAECGLIEWSGNGRVYAGELKDIWWNPSATVTVGRAATCNDEVYVANKANVSQLTHVWEYDAAPGPGWTNHFPSAAFPFDLLPNPMANGDAIVLTVDTTTFDSGPFSSAVFDISRPAVGSYTLTWYYPSGAAAFPPPGAGWTALNVYDGTASFSIVGVNSLHFVPPSDWAQIAVNGVTGYHIVGLVGGVAGAPVGPQQGNRDVYTANWPYTDVDDAQVLGDIPALLRFKLHNRSDEDGYAVSDELDLLDNRVVVGLRSLSRGAAFTAFLNCSDEQNPPGVVAAVGTGTAFGNETRTPTGRVATHTTTGGGLSSWDTAFTFTLGPIIARAFYGTFHGYVRAQLYEPLYPAGDHDDVRVRLRVRSGEGGVTKTTDYKQFRGYDAWTENYKDWQLLDFGQVQLPATGLLRSDELPDELAVDIEVASVAGTNLYVDLYDLVLIPTDEWAGDFVDQAYEDDSCVENGYLLDVDSLAHPKRQIRSLVRTADAAGFARAVWQPVTPGPAILQANADQRLWFLSARGVYMGEHDGGNNHAHLDDAYADFLDAGVRAGMTVYNVTDGSSAEITAVTATRVDGTLAGGTDNDWDNNDVYFIVCPNWRSEPWVVHSVQVWGNARYLSMRGAG